MNQISNAGQSWLHLFTRSFVLVSTVYSGRNATFFKRNIHFGAQHKHTTEAHSGLGLGHHVHGFMLTHKD